ncbi:hypothetical protein ACHAPJ_002988 [Fusarium lateritium]
MSDNSSRTATPVIVAVMMQELYQQTRHAAGGRPGDTIRNNEGLTSDEQMACLGLSRMENRGRHGNSKPDHLSANIFERWNKRHRANQDKNVQPRTFQDTNALVGTLKREHPPSIESGDACKEGASICLSLTLKMHENMIHWMWKDGNGRFVNPIHVDFHYGSEAACMDYAIDLYDQSESNST